ncbi:MAG: hypothetical protein HY078_02255 [Elusimicrobia bacterium]|nr:hypothetical protein [Elusimicrobiota bacterium]
MRLPLDAAALPAVLACALAGAAAAQGMPVDIPLREIGTTGWRIASHPPGFLKEGGRKMNLTFWDRDGIEDVQLGGRLLRVDYKERISVDVETFKDIGFFLDLKNEGCAAAGEPKSKLMEYSEGRHYGRPTYSWACVDASKPHEVRYTAYYQLVIRTDLETKAFTTIVVVYRVKLHGMFDPAALPLNDATMPGLAAYRAFKTSLSPRF